MTAGAPSVMIAEHDDVARLFLAVIWRRRAASSTSLNLRWPASSEALSAVRHRRRPRPLSGNCRRSINPTVQPSSPWSGSAWRRALLDSSGEGDTGGRFAVAEPVGRP